MRYVDKYTLHEKGYAINKLFLQRCWNSEENCMYPQIANADSLYDEYRKAEFRDKWIPLLLNEQDGRCCYCMRKLDDRKLNVEHVVPRSAKGESGQREYERYASNAPAIRDHVALVDNMPAIVGINDIDKIEKMPHAIAHSNLLASCNGVSGLEKDGVCCCNEARKNNYLLPLMLMEDGPERVRYSKMGIMYLTEEEASWETVIDKLNGDSLQQIRSVWYHLSTTSYTVDDIEGMSNMKDRMTLFKEAFAIDDFELLDEELQKYAGIESIVYWDILMNYDWFYNFYKLQSYESGQSV